MCSPNITAHSSATGRTWLPQTKATTAGGWPSACRLLHAICAHSKKIGSGGKLGAPTAPRKELKDGAQLRGEER